MLRDSWNDEKGKPQREWVFHVLIPRGVPICNGIFLMIPSWRLDCSMTTEAPWDRLFRTLTWWNWAQDFCPKCAEAFVSCFHPHGRAQVWCIFFYTFIIWSELHCHFLQYRVSLWYRVSLGQEDKENCSIESCAGFQVVLGSGWSECLGQARFGGKEALLFIYLFILSLRHCHFFCLVATKSRRGLRCPQGVVLGQGICARLQEEQSEKGSELGTGAIMVSKPWYVILNQAPPEIEDKEARLNTRNELWAGSGETEMSNRLQPE